MRLGIRIYGMGGQGIITLAKLIGEAAVEDGKFVIMTEEYSPYITGGWSKADLVVSDGEVDYPLPEELDYLITLSQEGLETNLEKLVPKSIIMTEKSLVSIPDSFKSRSVEIPAVEISKSLKNPRGTNIVIMGVFSGLTKSFSEESGKKAITKRFPKYVDVNLACFEKGYTEGVNLGR